MKTLISAALLILAGWRILGADETLPRSVSLSEVLREARQQNPEILAARKNWEMAQSRIRIAKSWPDPEIELELMGFSRSGLNAGTAEEKRYALSQTFPFPGKVGLRGKAAEHAANREEANYRALELDVLAQVKGAYFELIYAERAVGIVNESVEVLRRFSKISESKYASGKTSQSDVLRAQTELSKMLNRSVAAQQERETAEAKLNSLLNRSPDVSISAKDDPSLAPFNYSYQDLEKRALQNRPEIHAASHHATHASAELRAARSEFLPDTMLQYTWRMREGMEDDASAMVKLNLPFIWFRGRNAAIQSAVQEREHSDAMLQAAMIKTRYEVKEFLIHVQTARRLIDLYKTTILPQAEQSLRVSEAAYQSGKTGFLDLLDSERALIDFKLEYYKSLADYGTNLAHLERAVGMDLTGGKNE